MALVPLSLQLTNSGKGYLLKFGYSKFKVLTLSKGCVTTSDGFKLPSVSDETIASLEANGAYCYLGILESAGFHHNDKLSAEYRQRVLKFLQSHLTGSNLIHAINSYAIPILRYSAGIVSWTCSGRVEIT